MTKIILGVLTGGISAERYLSLRSGENICETLGNNPKYELYKIDWYALRKWRVLTSDDKIIKEASSLDSILDDMNFTCIFDVFSGQEEIDGHIAAILEMSGIPFVGNSFYTCFTAMNKNITNLILGNSGLPVIPDYIITSKNQKISEEDLRNVGFPCMLKPADSGSSVGMCLARSEKEIYDFLKLIPESYFPYLMEPFIKGKEYNVSVIGSYKEDGLTTLSPIHVCYPGEYFDAKCKEDDTYRMELAELSEDIANKMTEYAIKSHELLRATLVTRTDFIVQDSGKIWILEVNTHPGLSKMSILPATLKLKGISFFQFAEGLINQTLKLKS